MQFKTNPVNGHVRYLKGVEAKEAWEIAPTIIELMGDDVEEINEQEHAKGERAKQH